MLEKKNHFGIPRNFSKNKPSSHHLAFFPLEGRGMKKSLKKNREKKKRRKKIRVVYLLIKNDKDVDLRN